MNTVLKDLLNRIPTALIVAIYLGYLFMDFNSFTSDAESPFLQKKTQIEAAKKENVALQKKMKEAEEFFKKLETKKQELRALASRLDEMKGTLTEDLDIAEFIKMATTEAQKVGLKVVSLKPTSTLTKEFYVEQAFDMAYRGVYVQLLVFLERLSNVQKIVRVDNFDLHIGSSSAARFIELDGVIQIKTYRYLASKADDLAKNGGSVNLGNGSGGSLGGGTKPAGAKTGGGP